MTAPGFGSIDAFTLASEAGDIERFASPAKLCGYTGLCPRVIQSGSTDRHGPTSKYGQRDLRWGRLKAAMNCVPARTLGRDEARASGPMSASRSHRPRKRQRGIERARYPTSSEAGALSAGVWGLVTAHSS